MDSDIAGRQLDECGLVIRDQFKKFIRTIGESDFRIDRASIVEAAADDLGVHRNDTNIKGTKSRIDIRPIIAADMNGHIAGKRKKHWNIFMGIDELERDLVTNG